MSPRTFFVFNAAGGISWSATVALAGYEFGAAAAAIFTSITVVSVAVLLVLGLTAAWRRRRGAVGN
jgi:membrane protein DedA with SNARE-associated domain